MPKNKTTLRDIQVGDNVFVVEQNDRYRQQKDMPRKTSSQVVSRVGRLYAYIGQGALQKKFDRKTGISHHGNDYNVRANGYGFDVYVSEQEYTKEQHDKEEAKRLQTRLLNHTGSLRPLPPSAVSKIHKILNKEGV